MELIAVSSVLFFIVLYLVIKVAVSKGIDESTKIQTFKKELREMNSRLKKMENEKREVGKNVDKKV